LKRKISVVTGTRAEYGILRPVLSKIEKSKKLQLFLIVTGMHLSKKHGMTINEIKKDGLKIYTHLDMIPRGNSQYSMAEALGRGILGFSKIFKKLKPDINLILGDRDEVLAAALVASHMNIPTAHIHGGDKTQAGIDEYNRHAITKLSNIHFAATRTSKERILRMGENPKFVFLTGSPSIDEILSRKITPKKDLEKKYGIVFSGKDILLLQHPVTTQIERTKKQIKATLNAVVKFKKNTIAIAPNSDAGHIEIFKLLKEYEQEYKFLKVYPNLPRKDFLSLLQNCGVLVGNSSSGIIEASYFLTPVVNIGIRQKDRESGTQIINVPKEDSKAIYKAIQLAFKLKKKGNFPKRNPYGEGQAAEKIVHYLEKIKLDKELIQKQISF